MRDDMLRDQIRAWAQQGHYDEVLSSTIDNPDQPIDGFPWIVAALALVGRTAEAEAFYRSRRPEDLSAQDDAIARFFYGVAICRARKFRQARDVFLENFRLHVDRRHHSGQRSNLAAGRLGSLRAFYALQGLAFFRHATGRYRAGRRWSELASERAIGAGDLYSTILASELLGHLQCKTGLIHEGFRNFDIALRKCGAIGQGAVTAAILNTRQLYEARFGLRDGQETCAKLQRLLDEAVHNDSYSQASLRIELAHQYILRGALDHADKVLETACHYVYQVENPYLEVKYKLSLAYLLQRRGRGSQALPLINDSLLRSRQRKNQDMELQALGLRLQVMRAQKIRDDEISSLQTIKNLTAYTGSAVASRILQREVNANRTTSRIGEDVLGDIKDAVATQDHQAIPRIFASGYLGFLTDILGVNPAQKAIWFDLQPKGITLFADGNVWHSPAPYTNLSKKLLVLLAANRSVSKELLTKALWGQEYNPLRHDSLIYSLVNRTRKILGPFGDWIQNNEQSYFFGADIRTHSKTAPVRNVFEPEGSSLHADLNVRQEEIVALLQHGQRLQTSDIVERLNVSEATAARDLAKLVKQGYAARLGAGRSTYYILGKEEETP